MPKKYRLTGEEMRQLSRERGGKRMHGKFFSLHVSPLGDGHVKCAIVVSTKVSGKAVERNTIKRRARSVLEKKMAGAKAPLALVLYAKRDARGAAFSEIESDIDALFSKL